MTVSSKPPPRRGPCARGVAKPRRGRLPARNEVHDALPLLRSAPAGLMRNVFGHPVPPLPRHKPSVLLRVLHRQHSHKYRQRVRDIARVGSARGACAELYVVEVGMGYMPYVAAAYSAALPSAVGEAEVLLGDYESHALWSLYFYVARDDERKRVVVAVLGAKSLSDALTDLVADTVPFGNVPGGHAHRGFVMASTTILDKVRPVLRIGLHERPGYKVAVFGHSLGAAITQLLVMMMLDEGGFGEDLLGVAIAPPPVFGPLSAVDGAWAGALRCFVHADDVVSRASMFTLRNMLVETWHVDKLAVKVGALDAMDVALLEVDLSDHGATVFESTSKVVPGRAADCAESREIVGSKRKWVAQFSESQAISLLREVGGCAPEGVCGA